MSNKQFGIFDKNIDESVKRPLADRIRPQKLDDIIGHTKTIGSESALYKQIKSGFLPSLSGVKEKERNNTCRTGTRCRFFCIINIKRRQHE